MTVPVKSDKASGTLSVVTSRPENRSLAETLKQSTMARQVDVFIALDHAISAGIRKWYRGDIHAFSRAEQLINRGYPQMLDIYDQRAIDLDADSDSTDSLELDHTSSLAEVAASQTGTSPAVGQQASPTAPQPPLSAPESVAGGPAVSGSVTPPPAATPIAVSVKVTPKEDHGPAAQPAESATDTPIGQAAAPSPSTLLTTIGALVHLLEVQQGWKQGHSAEVERLAGATARAMELGPEEAYHLQLAALLHDIAKPPEPHLTLQTIAESDQARALAGQCYAAPAQLLQVANLPPQVLQILSSLYERSDGKGVPGRVNGDQVPRAAQILSIVDCFCDIMNNPRTPHGRAADALAALERMEQLPRTGACSAQVLAAFSGRLTAQLEDGLVFANRPKVLLIEPDAQQSRFVQQTLSDMVELRIVHSTAQAARELLAGAYDLVLSEVDVQPVDGFDFIGRIREDARTRHMPLIFLTSRSSAEDRKRSTELGALSFLSKPCSAEELQEHVVQALGMVDGGGARGKKLAGNLTDTPLADLLALLATGRKTGVLRVQAPSGMAEIYWETGRPVGARHDSNVGEQAIFSLLKLTTGVFAFDSSAAVNIRNIQRPLEDLIREGAAARQVS